MKLYEIDVENASGETREVNFNNELNPESINTENFYISEKEDGSNRLENVSVLFKEGSQKSVRISPEPDTLKHGITYYLFVRPEVESAIGNKINRFTRIKFNIN